MALNLQHQTAAQFAERLKLRFRAASKYERAQIAAWIYDRFVAGDITQAQIRTAFGLNTTEKWTAFRDRLLALRNYYVAIESEQPE